VKKSTFCGGSTDVEIRVSSRSNTTAGLSIKYIVFGWLDATISSPIEQNKRDSCALSKLRTFRLAAFKLRWNHDVKSVFQKYSQLSKHRRSDRDFFAELIQFISLGHLRAISGKMLKAKR
jgi:hypothetical protein